MGSESDIDQSHQTAGDHHRVHRGSCRRLASRHQKISHRKPAIRVSVSGTSSSTRRAVLLHLLSCNVRRTLPLRLVSEEKGRALYVVDPLPRPTPTRYAVPSNPTCHMNSIRPGRTASARERHLAAPAISIGALCTACRWGAHANGARTRRADLSQHHSDHTTTADDQMRERRRHTSFDYNGYRLNPAK